MHMYTYSNQIHTDRCPAKSIKISMPYITFKTKARGRPMSFKITKNKITHKGYFFDGANVLPKVSLALI